MKKFLSVILALAMVVSMLVITTFAESDSLDYDMTNIDTSKSAGTYAADGDFTGGSHAHGLYMPCFKLGYDNWACLGTLDLSKYDHAVIFYCTDGGYKALKDTMNGAVGLKSEGSSYGWADQTSYNLSGDLGHANTVDAYVTDAEAGGWASNIRAAFIDLTDVTYNGEVYASSFSSTGNELVITDILFLAEIDYDMTTYDAGKSAGTYAADGDFTSGSHAHGLYMPCFKLGYNNWLCLGNMDLSNIYGAYIYYCTDGGYKAMKDTMNGAVGFKSEASSYGWADQTSYNLSGDLGHANTVDAYVTDAEAGGWASNIRAAFIDLSNVDYSGDLYATSFSSTGNELVITDIVFIGMTEDAAPATLVGVSRDTVGYTAGGVETTLKDGGAPEYLASNPLVCDQGAWESVFLRGWVGYDIAIDTFGYKIDGGEFVAGSFTQPTEDAVKTPANGGANASRYKVFIPVAALAAGEHTVTASVKLSSGEICDLWTAPLTVNAVISDPIYDATFVYNFARGIGVYKQGTPSNLEFTDEDGYVAFKATGDDPYTVLSSPEGAAADLVWVKIKYRTTASSNKGEFYYGRSDGVQWANPMEKSHVDWNWNNDGEWNNIVFNATAFTEGAADGVTLNNFRFDPLQTAVTEGMSIDIAYIAFFKNEASADAYTGPTASTVENDYNLMADGAGGGVGYWMHPAAVGRYIEFTFTTPSCFKGFSTFIFATGKDSGGCKAKLELYSEGILLETIDLDCQGNSAQAADFSRTYPEGKYAIRIVGNDKDQEGVYIVLSWADKDASKDTTVTAVCDSNDANKVPYFTLKGAEHTTESAIAVDDPAMKSCDRVYVNTDTLSGDGVAASSDFVYDVTIEAGDTVNLLGWIWPGEGIAVTNMYYTVDGGAYHATDDALRARPDVDGVIKKAGSTGIGKDDDCLTLTDIGSVASGKHTVKVYAYSNGTMYNYITINLTVKAPTSIKTDKASYEQGTDMTVTINGAQNAKDWLGIYAASVTDYKNAAGGSMDWSYLNGEKTAPDAVAADGSTVKFTLISAFTPGDYQIVLLANDGYTVLAKATFSVTEAVVYGEYSHVSIDGVYRNNAAVDDKANIEMDEGDTIQMLGWILVDSNMKKIVYTVNGGEFIDCEDNYRDRSDVGDAYKTDGTHAGYGLDTDYMDLLGIEKLAGGTYTIDVYAVGNNGTYYKFHTITLKVNGAEPEEAETVGKYIDATKAVKGETETDYTSGTAFEKGTYDTIKLVGWYGANYAVESFGYRIGDGEAVYGEWAEDVDASDPVRAAGNGGDLAKRFEIPADISALAAGKYTVTYVAKLADGSVMDISAVEIEITETPVTPPPTGSAAAIIAVVAVVAIGAAIVVGKKRIAD